MVEQSALVAPPIPLPANARRASPAMQARFSNIMQTARLREIAQAQQNQQAAQRALQPLPGNLERLARAQQQAVQGQHSKGGGGLLDQVTGAAGDALSFGLDKLALGGSGVVAALKQPAGVAGNTLREIAGKKPVNLDLGFQAWLHDTENHINPIDVFGQQKVDPKTNKLVPQGKTQLNSPVADFALNLAAAVGTDPLTLVGVPIHGAEVPASAAKLLGTDAAIELGRPALGGARFAIDGSGAVTAAEDIGRPIADQAAAALYRSKSAASLSKEELAAIGKSGGYQIAGQQITPHWLYQGITAPTRALRGIAGDLLDKSEFLTQFRKGSGPYAQAMRSGDTEAMRANFQGYRAVQTEKLLGRGLGKQLGDEFAGITKNLSADEKVNVLHALGGERNGALTELGAKATPELQAWREKVWSAAREAGINLGHVEDYVPRRWTDEMKALQAGGKKGTLGNALTSLVKKQELGPGSTIFGETIPQGLSRGQVTSYVNDLAKIHLGHDMFSTNLDQIGHAYAAQVGRAIGDANGLAALQRQGLAATKNDVGAVVRATAQGQSADAAAGAASSGLADTAQAIGDTQVQHLQSMRNDLQNLYPAAPPAAVPAAVDGSGDLKNRVAQFLQTKQEIGKYGLGDVGAQEELRRLGEVLGTGKVNPADMPAIEKQLREAVTSSAARTAAESVVGGASSVAETAREGVDRINALLQNNPSAHLADVRSLYQQAEQWSHLASDATDSLRGEVATLHAQASALEAQLREAGTEGAKAEATLQNVSAKAKESLGREIQFASFQKLAAGNPEWRFDPELAATMNKVAELTAPRGTKELWTTFDKVTQYLKRWQLFSPRFEARLVFGHTWNNALGGVNVRSYAEAFSADHAFSGGAESWAKFTAEHGDLAQRYQQARRLIEGGQTQLGGVEMGRGGVGRFNPTRLTRAGGENIQRIMRTTFAMDKLGKGQSIEDVMQGIAKFHFDYSDLTGVERGPLRRVIPFYTWTRNNMPLQLEMMVKNPKVFAEYKHAVDSLAAVAGPSGEKVPNYFGEMGATFTGMHDVGGGGIYATNESLPIRDISGNLADPFRYLSMANPMIKTPIELFANKQFFKGLPLKNNYVDVPAVYKPFAPILRAAGFTNSKGQAENQVLYVMDQFAPMLANARRQVPSEKKYQDRAFSQFLNFVTGVGLRANTAAENPQLKVKATKWTGP